MLGFGHITDLRASLPSDNYYSHFGSPWPSHTCANKDVDYTTSLYYLY